MFIKGIPFKKRMEEKKRCLDCNKELEGREGLDKKDWRTKFCDRNCSVRYTSKKRHEELKNNEEYKEKARKRFNAWYQSQENKISQNKNVLNYYYKNKEQWRDKGFVREHKLKIMKFINPVCHCGNETKIIYHKKNGIAPKLLKGPSHEKENLKIVKKYTKENLIGFCSQLCMQKEKRKKKKEVIQ